MFACAYDRSKVMAVLGPTNTGKTHFAVERMLAHASGLIGFPLRLLAREIYDRIVAERGAGAVSLITGEEKITPPGARYVVATVEAMPQDLDVSFLAVDEIQLAADPERGHVFTDRLLNARGADETLFLGAETIRPLIRQLVPEAEIITRPRFSTLSYVEPLKVTRLPRRSAVVAFTAQDVYALAEMVRRHRGGAAVVLGALSPRTRNAQVELYQAGEVDYLIATDAIGMGLNMDLGHVALASVHKFDGREYRTLHPHEIGQIAGRAGRHMRDGTFGTTIDVGSLDGRIVEAVETHDFPVLKRLRWRNSRLGFSSLEELSASLDEAPPAPSLIKTRDALDDVSLKMLSRRDKVRERAAWPAGVRLLWSVCQIPDFRKTLTDAHLQLLETVFLQLSDRGRLATDWVADHIARLERTDGDIDTLIARLAHIRTWTYVSHRADWLDDAQHFQERGRAVEDRLSDALHDRLTQRFVDRRTQALLKSLHHGGPCAAVEDDGAIVVDGEPVGELRGLDLVLDPGGSDLERRTLTTAARRAVAPEIKRRARQLIEAEDAAFALDERNRLLWLGPSHDQAFAVGHLLPGQELLAPRLGFALPDMLEGRSRESVKGRLDRWLTNWVAQSAEPLRRLKHARLTGAGRGLAYVLVEGQGNAPVRDVKLLLSTLGDDDRGQLTRLGVRFGVRHVYLPAMLKGQAIEVRARLFALHHRTSECFLPPAGRVAFAPGAGTTDGFLNAVGYERLGDHALRIDMVERLGARLRALARSAPFELPPDLMALAGLGTGDLAAVVADLGYEPQADGRFRRRSPPARRPRLRRPAPQVSTSSPFAALAKLKRSG